MDRIIQYKWVGRVTESNPRYHMEINVVVLDLWVIDRQYHVFLSMTKVKGTFSFA